MTPQQIQRRLAGQPTVAQKVFDLVPIQDPQTAGEICQEAYRRGIPIDQHTVKGCLRILAEARLIRRINETYFLRDPLPPSSTTPKKEASPMAEANKETKNKSSSAATATSSSDTNDLTNQIANIAATLRTYGNHLIDQANELDEVALVIAEQDQKTSKEAGKLKQLKELLKSL